MLRRSRSNTTIKDRQKAEKPARVHYLSHILNEILQCFNRLLDKPLNPEVLCDYPRWVGAIEHLQYILASKFGSADLFGFILIPKLPYAKEKGIVLCGKREVNRGKNTLSSVQWNRKSLPATPDYD